MLEERDNLGVELRVALAPGEEHARLSCLDDAAKIFRERIAIREGCVQDLHDVECHGGPDQLHERERRHRHAHGAQRPIDDHEVGALIDRSEHLSHDEVEQPVHDEAGGVLHEDCRLLQGATDRESRGERGLICARRRDDLEQGHDRDRVEEVEPDDALRMRHLARHLGEGKRGGIRGDDASVGDDGLELREDLLLDRHVLEDSLDDESGVGEAVL